ncbi:MAG: metallophosphoesterase, partial [Bacteroidaceae bacterium]|nr:metallophosphoesterase [Bacteroidaceae bacterium]
MNLLKKCLLIAAVSLVFFAGYSQNHSIWQVSDIHVMGPDVCKSPGKAWDLYNFQEPQLDLESRSLFQAVIDSALLYKPEIFIISGDLTKNGEKDSHEFVAKVLKQLKDQGIKVYVIPGNHDLHNPTGYIFDGDEVTRAQGLTEQEFVNLYNDFGYKNAISRDKNTLSYVAYPTEDLALLCMDTNDWSTAVSNEPNNPDTTERVSCAGKYSEETLRWMEEQAEKAQKSNRRVFVVQHQALFQHFDYEATILGTDLVNSTDKTNNESTLVQRMANMGVKIVFSGHRHFHDINYLKTTQGDKVWEINTGSLVEQQPAYRVCELRNDTLDINTVVLRNINLNNSGLPTDKYAYNWYYESSSQYLRALCLAIWPMLQEYTKELPSAIGTLNLKIPTTYSELYDMVRNHFLNDNTMTIYYLMAVGNENNTDSFNLIKNFLSDIDAMMLEICNNDKQTQSTIMTLISLLYPELDIKATAKKCLTSALGNYISANGNEIIDDAKYAIALLPDKAEFEDYKISIITSIDALSIDDDSQDVLDLISKAKDEINSLQYDKNKSLEKNKISIDTIFTKLKSDIESQRIADKLKADKAEFEIYKSSIITDIDTLSIEGDSQDVLDLISNAKDEINSLQYDENITLEENEIVVDSIFTELISDVESQRIADKLKADKAEFE